VLDASDGAQLPRVAVGLAFAPGPALLYVRGRAGGEAGVQIDHLEATSVADTARCGELAGLRDGSR
jgi:hypothetical protein